MRDRDVRCDDNIKVDLTGMKFMGGTAGYNSVECILEKIEADLIERKLVQYKQKC